MCYWGTSWSSDICIFCIIYIRVNMWNSLNTYNFFMAKTLTIISFSFLKDKVNYCYLWSVSWAIITHQNVFLLSDFNLNLLLATFS